MSAEAAVARGIRAGTVVVVGKEGVGKSQLIASLTGARAYSSNFRGTTITCDEYESGDRVFVDTPGIFRASDAATVRATLERADDADVVLLVVQATHLDDDLADMLPLVGGRTGVVVATFWDRVRPAVVQHCRRKPLRERSVRSAPRSGMAARDPDAEPLAYLARGLGVPVVPVDARQLTAAGQARITAALEQAGPLPTHPPGERAGWHALPRPTWLEHRRAGPLLGTALLLAPALLAVWLANTVAGALEPAVEVLNSRVTETAGDLPGLARETLVGGYGLLTMGPLLLVWAVPTVVLYALLLGAYKASGLIERISAAMHPLVRPFGLAGRDLVRVVMGFGCNVPAVISSRACSSCSRGACVSAIAFGAACSYQLGATLGVFAAARMPMLVVPYLLYLLATTALYTRLVSPPAARSPLNVLVVEHRTFLVWPRPTAVWREASGTLEQFFRQAIPIFVLITIAASLLHGLGAVDAMAGALAPAMAVFRLPTDAAVPVLLASIRKDGILLFAEPGLAGTLSPIQVLTGVYLAGVLLPCLVTAFTIAREISWSYAGRLACRQVLAAVVFAALLAWAGAGLPAR